MDRCWPRVIMLLSLIVGHLVPGGLLILVHRLCHSSPFSRSFDQKAVFLCDISMVHQTTGVNYSRIKLTIVSHLIQMLCFNKEPFRNMGLSLSYLNRDVLIRLGRDLWSEAMKQQYAACCHPATGGVASNSTDSSRIVEALTYDQRKPNASKANLEWRSNNWVDLYMRDVGKNGFQSQLQSIQCFRK